MSVQLGSGLKFHWKKIVDLLFYAKGTITCNNSSRSASYMKMSLLTAPVSLDPTSVMGLRWEESKELPPK